MVQKKATTNNIPERKAFSFYKSYWDCYKQLTNSKEKIEFLEIINKVQFLETHIDLIKPKNQNVKLLFASIKYGLTTSIRGYCGKLNIDYDNYPWQGVGKGLATPSEQEEVQEQVKEEVKEQVKEVNTLEKLQEWDFAIDKSFYAWIKSKNRASLTKSYVRKRIEDIVLHCKSNGKEYKDYKSTLQTWINRDIKGWEQYEI